MMTPFTDGNTSSRPLPRYSSTGSLQGGSAQLIDLGEALSFWRDRTPDDVEDPLKEMRLDCSVLHTDPGEAFNVLHTRPSKLVVHEGGDRGTTARVEPSWLDMPDPDA